MIPLVEQRAHRRLVMEMPVGVSFVSNLFNIFARKPRFWCTTRDVSVSGMQILADCVVPHGAMVRLWVKCPIGGTVETLQLRGRVRWSKHVSATGPCLAGISLNDQPEHFMAIWMETIRDRIRQYFRKYVPGNEEVVI